MKFPSQIDRRLVLKAGLMLATPMQTFSVLQNTENEKHKSLNENDLWQSIRTEFPMDRTMINLNNGE